MLSTWMELSHARYTIHSPPYCIEEVISFHETENTGNHQWISPTAIWLILVRTPSMTPCVGSFADESLPQLLSG